VKQRTFLPLFFLGLAVVLVAAVGLRIRAYNTRGEAHATINSESPVAPTVAVQERRTDGMTAAQPDVIPVSQTVAAAQQRAVAGGGATATTAPVGMSREQRFAEALAAAQRAGSDSPQKLAMPKPAPAPSAPAVLNAPKPPENPGLLARIGNAISNAFSGSSRASAAPQQAASQNQQNNPSQRHGDAPREKDVPDRPREKDPTSDTTPPQLQGIIFQPPSINDGQETALIVTAVDDLSGIRNISGSVASPTGKALQGFACQREAPESNRYIARIVVPKDAEQGFWKINFLSLTDNASNTTNINMAQTGGAGFTVNSARPDSQPPSLRGVYVDKRSMTGGEKNTIFVQATDDKSGVAIVSGVFQSPNKSARIGFGCRPTGNDNFECDFVPPKDIDCGDWQLEQIQLQDKAQNMATIRGDNPLVAAVKINMLANRCDSTPPAVENLQLDPLDTTANGVVTVTGTVTDDISGVASISGQAAGPPSPDNAQQPPRVYFSFQAGPDPNTWIGKINMPDKAAKGTWSIVWLQTIDKANNNRTYTVNDAVLQGTKFTVR
jgi:hypothetical protein